MRGSACAPHVLCRAARFAPPTRRIGKRGAHFVAAKAVDNDDLARLERARRVEHVREERPAGERVQHFRQGGMHAIALTRGKHDHVERHGRILG
jgi:hypothetical protein